MPKDGKESNKDLTPYCEQIWIAVSVYVLVAIMKKRLNFQESLYTILQILSVSVFEKTSIYQMITDRNNKLRDSVICKQLKLF